MTEDGGTHDVLARQLWNFPSQTASAPAAHCTPFMLPSNGVLQLGDDSSITLTTNVLFQPQCTGTSVGDILSMADMKQPFYASTIPMVYVIAAATVIAWVLVVMLTITPRTSFFGLPANALAFSNGRGIIGGANGGTYGSGSGSRPWLQKVAALAVAISLTIATADTLKVAQEQYISGIMEATLLRSQVLGSMEIKITRAVSDIFLWLAQVQTLIRLFPRHKEKVLIKWIGFVLIILDSIFSCLNSFLIDYQSRGRQFVDAIPALSYLFELALGLLYAAWVLYYSLTKRRYAYYNPKMRSITLIALLSLISILTPVVFFVTDVVNQDVAGWGDYFRWVGAAAASVVVWEWVERIEALERDDKKDGILGREIFDGDEMLDVMPSENAPWSQSRSLRRTYRSYGRDDDPEDGNQASIQEHGFSGMAHRFRSRHQQSPQHYPLGRAHSNSEAVSSSDRADAGRKTPTITFSQPSEPRTSDGIAPPKPAVSPVNRADTTSAASTVYVVRYHPVADVPQPIRRRAGARNANTLGQQLGRQHGHETINEKENIGAEDDAQPNRNRTSGPWHAVTNPFKRKRTSPPQEVQRARAAAEDGQRPNTPAQISPKWTFRSRLDALTNVTGSRTGHNSGGREQNNDLAVTVIPAQPRGSTRMGFPEEHVRSRETRPAAADVPGETRSSGGNPSTTLVDEARHATTLPRPRQAQAIHANPLGLPRQDTRGTFPAETRTDPPRADDISPPPGVGTGNEVIVVPAPCRRTPSFQNTATPIENGVSRSGSAAPKSESASHARTPPNE